jgi:hypothetical protein
MTEILDSVNRNIDNITQVSEIARREMAGALSLTFTNNRNEFAGVVRRLGPSVLNNFGNISATSAVYHYQEMRDIALKNTIGLQLSNRARNRRFNAQVAASQSVDIVKYIPTISSIDVPGKTESMISYALSKFDSNGYIGGQNAAIDYALREIAMANRDTVLFNATLDKSVQGVQRVADPNACAFCLTIALGGSRSFAADYHSDCRCTVEPIFKGQSDIRPAYYDSLEEKYNIGRAAARETGDTSAKSIFAAIRSETGSK